MVCWYVCSTTAPGVWGCCSRVRALGRFFFHFHPAVRDLWRMDVTFTVTGCNCHQTWARSGTGRALKWARSKQVHQVRGGRPEDSANSQLFEAVHGQSLLKLYHEELEAERGFSVPVSVCVRGIAWLLFKKMKFKRSAHSDH